MDFSTTNIHVVALRNNIETILKSVKLNKSHIFIWILFKNFNSLWLNYIFEHVWNFRYCAFLLFESGYMKNFRRRIDGYRFFRSKPTLNYLIPISCFIVAYYLTILSLLGIYRVRRIRNKLDFIIVEPCIIKITFWNSSKLNCSKFYQHRIFLYTYHRDITKVAK